MWCVTSSTRGERDHLNEGRTPDPNAGQHVLSLFLAGHASGVVSSVCVTSGPESCADAALGGRIATTGSRSGYQLSVMRLFPLRGGGASSPVSVIAAGSWGWGARMQSAPGARMCCRAVRPHPGRVRVAGHCGLEWWFSGVLLLAKIPRRLKDADAWQLH